jgi:hypothetical protein
MALARHSWDFFKGALPVVGFALAAVSDPLGWLHALGFMTDTVWNIEPWARQSLFATAAFISLFLWYLGVRRRYDERKPGKGDFPIHQAARYIISESAWAAKLPPDADDDWVVLVSREILSALACGRVRAWGRLRHTMGMTQEQTIPIPLADLQEVEWVKDHQLVTDVPPHTLKILNTERNYHRVKLNRRQVQEEWPRRSVWAKLRGRSPIDRWNEKAKESGKAGYIETFAKQDANYGGAPEMATIAEFLGER